MVDINKVLGIMPVEKAEQVVELLGNGGMLAIREEILNAAKPGFRVPEYITSKQFGPDAESSKTAGIPARMPLITLTSMKKMSLQELS